MATKPSTASEAAVAACRWVRRYREEARMTPRRIYDETAYSDFFREVSEEALERVLREDRALVDAWEMFSGDKRWSPAWYFTLDGERPYVGYYPPDPHKREKHFDDPVKACAYFVKMEMEDFRAP
jgi:hypothetical protein